MKTAILYHGDLKNYDLGEGHPFRGDRFKLFLDFFESRCVSLPPQFEKIQPPLAGDDILRLVHTQGYIKRLTQASQGIDIPDIHNYLSGDNLNPLTGNVPKGIERAARIIVGSSVLAGELVVQGKFSKAIGIGGGLHHAKPGFGEGFCFYNDVAVSVENLKQKYNLQRILVLDTDAHAGNGTKEIFYSDPRVLFIDLHQDPRTIYPGTGFIQETGRGRGEGFTVNLPLLPGAAIEAYQYIFEEIILPLAKEFDPEVVVRYGGSDPHYLDGLTNLGLTLEAFRMMGAFVRQISGEVCQGKAVDLLTSGYNLGILPFAWSGLISGLSDLEIDLSGLKEENPPPKNYRLDETKDMVKDLKRYLRKYWKSMLD